MGADYTSYASEKTVYLHAPRNKYMYLLQTMNTTVFQALKRQNLQMNFYAFAKNNYNRWYTTFLFLHNHAILSWHDD